MTAEKTSLDSVRRGTAALCEDLGSRFRLIAEHLQTEHVVVDVRVVAQLLVECHRIDKKLSRHELRLCDS
jgi:hypothetical protein